MIRHSKPKQDAVYVMSNDPSMTAWGWSIIDVKTDTIISSGAFKTTPVAKKLRIRKGDDNTRRISEVNRGLLAIINKYHPVYIIGELPYGAQSANAALMLGYATCILQSISDILGIGLEWFSEADAKKAVSGQRSIGSKDQMVELVKKKYSTFLFRDIKWIDQAVADSVAIYCAACKLSNTFVVLKGNF